VLGGVALDDQAQARQRAPGGRASDRQQPRWSVVDRSYHAAAASQLPMVLSSPPVSVGGAVWAVGAQKVDRSGPVQLESITT